MPLTQLDPVAALVVIDLQKGIVGISVRPAHHRRRRRSAPQNCASAFRKRNLPVVLVNVEGRAPGRVDATFNFSPPPDWAELVPELDRQPSDYTVDEVSNRRVLRNGARTHPAPRRRHANLPHRSRNDRRRRSHGARGVRSRFQRRHRRRRDVRHERREPPTRHQRRVTRASAK